MRRLAFATVIALMSPAALVPSAAAGNEVRDTLAAEGETAVCAADPYPVSLSPGLTLLPAEATFATPEPAAVACQGSVQGHQVTGVGTISVRAILTGPAGGATCEKASGHGRAVFTMPTADGPVEFVNNFTFESAGPGGIFTGDVVSGVFHLSPIKGDCVTEPLTIINLGFEAVIHG